MARGRPLRRRVPPRGARSPAVRPDRRGLFHDPWNAADSVTSGAARARAAGRMMRIALTGSIGMGKSAVAAMFRRAGIPVFDADAVVRGLQGPGGALVGAIGAAFPGTVSDGMLHREELARIVLEDRRQLAELEAIVHPAVEAAREAFAKAH